MLRTGQTLIGASHCRVHKAAGELTASRRLTALKFRSAAVLTLFLPAIVVGAAATAERGSEEDRMACAPDVFRHCSEFIPNADRITACLRQRVRELSPECRIVMTRLRRG